MADRVLAVIPARLGSKRFPDKVIYPFDGKPLLFYVHREVSKAKEIDRVVIATDSERIVTAATEFGAEVVKTSARHQTGSDRVAEVARKLGGDIVINVQADNFGLKSTVIDRFIKNMKSNRGVQYATLARRINLDAELFSPNLVKVVIDKSGRALWFSRYALPYIQSATRKTHHSQFPYLGHIGVYGFRRKALEEYAAWERTPLEKAESLEQLRVLEHGKSMRVFVTRTDSVEINSPEDLKKLRRIYK